MFIVQQCVSKTLAYNQISVSVSSSYGIVVCRTRLPHGIGARSSISMNEQLDYRLYNMARTSADRARGHLVMYAACNRNAGRKAKYDFYAQYSMNDK